MGVDKVDVEGDGFFHLFDWKRKSQKNFVSKGASSPEIAELGRKINNLESNELPLFDEKENGGASSSKGSEHSGSSVSGEGTTGTRAPGLVAKLMGLDSMPASVASESYLAPNYSHSLQDDYHRIRSPEFNINNQFNHIPVRAEGYCRKQQESRSKSVPISHTRRPQVEPPPQKSARSQRITNQKLSSIYNPGFFPLPNRVHVTEATTNTNQPECKTNTRGKIQPSRPSSTPVRVCISKEIVASERVPNFPESSGRIEDSTAMTSLKNRGLNSMKGIGFSSPTSGTGGTNLDNVEDKAGSKSLSVQAKAKIQRTKGSNTGSKSTLAQKDLGHCKWNQSFKSQNQESKHQKKLSATNASDVLRKNNQKQNCKTNQDNFARKPPVPKRDAPSGKKNIVNKLSRNSKIGYSKELSGTPDFQKEAPLPGRKNFSLKKSVIEEGKYQEKKRSTDNIIVGRNEKHIQHDRSNNTDIVSFTFSSPMVKSRKCQIFSEVDKLVKGNGPRVDTQTGRMALDAISANLSSLEFKDLADDTLGFIVEQKLRKLTSGSYSPFLKDGSKATSPLIMPVSDFGAPGAAPAEAEKEEFKPCKHKLGCFLDHDLSPISGRALGEPEGSDSNSCDWKKQAGHHLRSPLSVLETSFSNEYSMSSESTDGDKMCPSIQVEPIINVNCTNKIPSIEDELELSDLACSAVIETLNEEHTLEISREVHSDAYTFELEIFRDMSNGILSILKDLGSYQIVHSLKTLDPTLFEELECRKCSATDGKDVDCRLRRKILIDCMKECLDKKYNCYFQAGYRAWTKGTALFGNGMLEEICKEILAWKSMREWMVDELIDRDMSSHLGRWINFEIEAFEVGMDIESVIFSSLVDEVVTDCLSLS